MHEGKRNQTREREVAAEEMLKESKDKREREDDDVDTLELLGHLAKVGLCVGAHLDKYAPSGEFATGPRALQRFGTCGVYGLADRLSTHGTNLLPAPVWVEFVDVVTTAVNDLACRQRPDTILGQALQARACRRRILLTHRGARATSGVVRGVDAQELEGI